MKKILILALATAAAIPAFSQSFADKLMDRYNVGYGEAILLGGLARDFGLHDSVVFDMRNRYGYNDNDLLTALTLQKYGRRDRDDIYQMRRSGMGWGQIAHAIGMHPGEFNKARKAGKFGSDRDVYDDVWRHRFERKRTSSRDLDWARNQGINYRDAYIADVISRSRGSDYRGLLTNYRNSRDWDSRSNVRVYTNPTSGKKVAPPKKNKGGGFDDNKNKAKNDKSKGKGKSNGKGKGKG